MTPDPRAALRLAETAAVASRDILRVPAAAEARLQVGRDIKLHEDTASEALIIAALNAGSPWPVLSEEAGWVGEPPGDDEPYWVVDPLDGSFNHFRGTPLCCTAVAACVGFTPIAGAIYDFNRDELFSGGPGLGLFLNQIPFTPTSAPTGVLSTGFPVRGDFSGEALEAMALEFRRWTKVRMIGAAALSLAWVAAGRFDAYQENGISWWDVAAGLALVQAAGGTGTAEGVDLRSALRVRAYRPGMEPQA